MAETYPTKADNGEGNMLPRERIRPVPAHTADSTFAIR